MLTTKHILIFYLLTECQYILLYPIDQYFEDWGQCIPIKCINGEPPENCTTLCSSANLQTTCRPKTDFCLCLKPAGNGRWDLVSPDEVATLFNLTDTNRDNHTDASKINQTDSSTETDSDDVSVETFSATIFGFFTYIIPFPVLDAPDQNETIYFEELPPENKGVTGTDKEVTDSKKEATDSKKEMPDEGKENVEREELLNEVVNVHEGRLFWDFCYILTGLLLLMLGLILYEIYMCRKMAKSGKSNGVQPLINAGFTSNIFTVGNEKLDAQKVTQ